MGEQRTLNSPVVGSSPTISTKLGTVMKQSLYRKFEEEFQREFEKYLKCPKCNGTGKLDDNDGFGFSYNEWDCDSCGGDGIRKLHPVSK